MATTSWRIASPGFTWAANDLSGNGSALHPGRWNSRNRPLVYSSSSIALACLETVVHLAGDDPLPFQRQLVRITIPRQHWEQRKVFDVQEHSGWRLPPTLENTEGWLATTRAWGEAWLLSLESLVAEVPSVIVPEESNLLLNPRHPGHREVVAEIVRPWVYDTRLLPAARAAVPQAGPPWQQPLGGGVALEMVPIPAGEFLMGSPPNEEGRDEDEGPQHRVQLAPFSIGRMPITQAQWRQVASWRPAAGEPPWERELAPECAFFQRGEPEDDQRPVEQVSWFEAMEFCRRLNRRTGRTYTLPSEAQWEYACRAGTTTPFAFGSVLSERQANVRSSETTQVGSFPANAWGLHDMHGNVWEWCADAWHPNYLGAPNDGSPWIDSEAKDDLKVLRGGSWDLPPGVCRSAYRNHVQPFYVFNYFGFRVVCLNPS